MNCPVCTPRGESHATGLFCATCHDRGDRTFYLKSFPGAGIRHKDDYGRLVKKDHEPKVTYWDYDLLLTEEMQDQIEQERWSAPPYFAHDDDVYPSHSDWCNCGNRKRDEMGLVL